jgi:hypothetical protein
MGCDISKQAPAADKKVRTENEKVNLDTLSRAERFEMTIPLVYTKVEDFCRLIRGIRPEKTTLTVDELLNGMDSISAWKKVQHDHIFHKLLEECTLLRQDGKGDLLKSALLLWGIILCGGSSELKTTLFYDIL